jgi:micrococcal nuclease
VSRHWKPDRRSEWTVIDGYGSSAPARGGVVPVVLSAVLIGFLVGGALSWTARHADPSAAIDFANARDDSVRASFSTCKWGGGTNCVVDGDTFYIGGEKVRIAGIDAPETHPPRCNYEARLGEQATEKLRALLNSGAVTMTSVDRDRDVYGRLLRNVQVNGADVGAAMVASGVARDYGRGRHPWC